MKATAVSGINKRKAEDALLEPAPVPTIDNALIETMRKLEERELDAKHRVQDATERLETLKASPSINLADIRKATAQKKLAELVYGTLAIEVTRLRLSTNFVDETFEMKLAARSASEGIPALNQTELAMGLSRSSSAPTDQRRTKEVLRAVAREISNSSSSSALESSILTEDEALERVRRARREVEELQMERNIDESILQAAIRRKKKAELIYANVVFRAAEASQENSEQPSESPNSVTRNRNEVRFHDEESPESPGEDDELKTELSFEDSSLLDYASPRGQRTTLEIIPISADIDLQALGDSVAQVQAERGGPWVRKLKIAPYVVGRDMLIVFINRDFTCEEVDWICDRLTAEFPGDIESIQVKFHV